MNRSNIIIALAIMGVLFSTVNGLTQKQETILDYWRIKFNLPNNKWSSYRSDENNDKSLYIYSREAVESNNTQVVPTIGIICERLEPDTDIVFYSTVQRLKVPFTVKKVFSINDGMLKIPNAIGFIGTQTDSRNIEHRIMVIHIVNKDIGIQIIIDTTSDTFKMLQPEFDEFVKTIEVM